MKKYIVEFVELNGNVYEFEFLTDDIEKSIDEYYRNRSIANHRILNEGTDGQRILS